MGEANAHYYATRDPLGEEGDFTTAPEISQMFGEMVGAALADCWDRAGRPENAIYAELGPGRGTLATDALRVMAQAGLNPEAHFVETSPVLRELQRQRHPSAGWHSSLVDIPGDGPLLLVANEFFDALPIRQWVGDEERRVALEGDRFIFTNDGLIREESSLREAVARDISAGIASRGGAALIVDYGHLRSAIGDTLQAVQGHRYADVLANPGEQDLTSHVDFETLARATEGTGVATDGPVEQGQWLEALGIGQRTAALTKASPNRAAEFVAAKVRLCDSSAMGSLFKVMAIRHGDWPAPVGLER
ncbi:MAG TPA: SAM-dependent methyltransferase [Sphingomicrobium sp.]|nr:SAM-dependent methyltransferase [Sphingomicrobium sp.]